MLLTELLFQRVQGLGVQGHVALKAGYVALQCGAASLRHALVAAIAPQPDDGRLLTDGQGPTRVGVGIENHSGGPSFRLLRELAGERQLQRLDPPTRKFQLLSKDSIEIESFLRLECGVPAPDVYARIFVLEPSELPSVRNKPAPAEPAVDQARVAALKAELEQTRNYEDAQDQLFKVAVKHRELEEAVAGLRQAIAVHADLEQKLAKVAYTPAERQGLIARLKKLPVDEKKRDDELQKIRDKRAQLRDEGDAEIEPFYKTTLFSGGMAAGIVIDGLAFFLAKPAVAFLGLVGFGAALVAALQWIASDESAELARSREADLRGREDRVKKNFQDETAPLRAAMTKAKLTDPQEMLTLFNEVDELEKQRDAAAARVDELKKQPHLFDADGELRRLTHEKQELELTISTQGFARPINQIEADLKAALGLSAVQTKKPKVDDAEVPKALFKSAAEALGSPVEPLAGALEPRLAAYLTALTDKRVVAGRMDGNGQLSLSTPDGRWGAYQGMPEPLRDLVYVALRLALLERVSSAKKVPVVVDDAFAPLEPAKRQLVGRMLKGLSAQVQVLHRSLELPPQGLADHLVKIP